MHKNIIQAFMQFQASSREREKERERRKEILLVALLQRWLQIGGFAEFSLWRKISL